jgi:hypothetical protein
MKNLNEGTSEDARDGNVICLVYKAKEVANQPVVPERLDIPVPQLPQPRGFTSVEVVNFSQTEFQTMNISTDCIYKAF